MSNLASNPASTLLLALLLFFPSQLGRHFWPDFSYLNGLRVDYLSPTLYFTDILVMLLFIEVLPILIRKVGLLKLTVSLIPLLLLLYVSLQSISPVSSLLGTLRLLEIVFIAFCVAWILPHSQMIKRSAFVLSLALIAVSLLGINQFMMQRSIGGLWYWLGERSFSTTTPGIANALLDGTLVLRPYATFPHPNVLSAFAVVVITFLLFTFSTHTTKIGRSLILSAVLLGTIVTVLSLSRVNLVILFVVYFIWIFSRRWFTLFQKMLVMVILLGLGGIVFVSGYSARLMDLTLRDEALVIRSFLTHEALAFFEQSPLIGIGVQNFLPTLAHSISPLTPHLYFQPAHSIYLLILSETGILGSFLAVCLILLSIKKLFLSQERVLKGTLLLVLLLLGLTDHYLWTLHQGQLLMAFVFGVIWMSGQTSLFTSQKEKISRTGKHTKKSVKKLGHQPVKNSRNGRPTHVYEKVKTPLR